MAKRTELLMKKYAPVASTKTVDLIVTESDAYRGGPVAVTQHSRYNLDDRGRFAMAFIERWAMGDGRC